MRVLVAPDKFKGSLTAAQAAAAIARGIKKILPQVEIDLFPMADGGEGTLDALATIMGGKILSRRVHDPLGKPVMARWGWFGSQKSVAIIEMAEASGLHLVPARKRNPLLTSTFGTGELICAALKRGCREIVIGIGGSATVDGGVGMAQALGVEFFDRQGYKLGRPLGGGDLEKIARIGISNLPSQIYNLRAMVATDVQNPLLGSKGAARMFGLQKGATPIMVERLERGLRHYARILSRDVLGSPKYFSDLVTFPGSGAAGGLGVGLRAFLKANFVSGAEMIMHYGHFDARLRRADLVITGEGRLDIQSLHGKTPVTVARRAKKFCLPVLVLAGSVGKESESVAGGGIS